MFDFVDITGLYTMRTVEIPMHIIKIYLAKPTDPKIEFSVSKCGIICHTFGWLADE